MANVILSDTAAVDTRVEAIVPAFGAGLKLSDPDWYVEELDEADGSDPAFIKVIIPNSKGVRDELAASVALNPAGPVKDMFHEAPVAARKRSFNPTDGTVQETLLFVGEVTRVRHDIENDNLVVIGMDARHKLRDIRIFGRYILGDTEQPMTATARFQQGWPTHFNPGGRPNCCFTINKVPVFAPYPDYELSDDQQPVTVEVARDNPGKVCSWTLSTICEYIQRFYSFETSDETAGVVAAAEAAFPEIQRLPEWIKFPVGFGSNLDTYSISNFDTGVGQTNQNKGGARKGRDIRIQGMPFAGKPGEPGFLDLIFAGAGGASWTCEYAVSGNSYKNILKAVPTRFGAVSKSVDMPYACRGKAEDIKIAAVTAGFFEESSEFTFSRVVGMGSLVKIETRCSMDSNDHGGGTPALLKAWSDDDYDAWRTLAVTLGGGTANRETVMEAHSRYWWVGTTYVLNPAFNFQANTSESVKPRAPIPRPVWPFLLSFQGGDTLTPRDKVPYPIRTELNTGSTWVLGPQLDGLETWDNGVLYLSTFIEAWLNGEAGAFRWNSGEYGVSAGKLNITANNVRLTIAIPCDHRLTHVARLSSDVAAGSRSANWIPVEDSPDQDKLKAGYTRQITVDLNTLYEGHLRYNSYPEPAAAGGTAFSNLPNFSHDYTQALRSDEPYLKSHIIRRLLDGYRLEKKGPLVFEGTFVTSYPIGTQVDRLVPVHDPNKKAFNARFVVRRRRFVTKMVEVNKAIVAVNSSEVYPG
ncbi:MAG TPA: hypothetical protein VEK08_26970 [Planctomycetota bacterium]|nr:hypothetical protein [Planctomycetota bacterium]